ncbi:MAG: hypothetical protein AB1635_13755 [Acidobacteriota bacterium]
MAVPGDDAMQARLTKIEKRLSALTQDVRRHRNETQSSESRLRVLIEEARTEARVMFDGVKGMLERIEERLDGMERYWKATDADRQKVLADHGRRITLLERRRR